MTAWTQPETDLLVSLWNDGKPIGEIVRAIPTHGTEPSIKKQLSRLRSHGVALVSRKLAPMPAEKARRRKLACIKAWKQRQEGLPPSPKPMNDFPLGLTLFGDDPRADDDHGSWAAKIIPQVDLSRSPSVSTAALAVRG